MKSLKGHLLVATAHLSDPNFIQTVLLIFEHDEAGAAGVVLNRPTEATLAKISEDLFQEPVDWDKPIHLGGPVVGPLMALHKVGELADQEVLEGVYSTVDPDKLHELIQQQAEPSLFVANYAGWGPGQLESELIDDSWLYTPAQSDQVLEPGDIEMWHEAVKSISAHQLSEMLGLNGNYWPTDGG